MNEMHRDVDVKKALVVVISYVKQYGDEKKNWFVFRFDLTLNKKENLMGKKDRRNA